MYARSWVKNRERELQEQANLKMRTVLTVEDSPQIALRGLGPMGWRLRGASIERCYLSVLRQDLLWRN